MKKKSTNSTLNVRGTDITVIRPQDEDYISLTDIAKHREPDTRRSRYPELDEKPKHRGISWHVGEFE